MRYEVIVRGRQTSPHKSTHNAKVYGDFKKKTTAIDYADELLKADGAENAAISIWDTKARLWLTHDHANQRAR